MVVCIKRTRNRIDSIIGDHIKWIDDPTIVEDLFKQYFMRIYNELIVVNVPMIDSLLTSIELLCLNMEHVVLLNLPFTIEEVLGVVKQIGPLKASRIDGKPIIFYKKFSHIISEDVIASTLAFLNFEHILKEAE